MTEQESISASVPWSCEAEQAVLAACFESANRRDAIFQEITEDHFFHPAHLIIWQALVEMQNANKPIEQIAVTIHLMERGLLEKIGGAAELDALVMSASIVHQDSFYMEILHDRRTRRAIISSANRSIQLARDETKPYKEAIEAADAELAVLQNNPHATKPRHVREIMRDVIEEAELRYQNKGKILGITLGVPDLDRTINGLESPDLFFIGARPGMGKTALVGTFFENVALTQLEAGLPTLMFSLEMSAKQIMRRAWLSHAGVAQTKGRTGFFAREDWIPLMRTNDAFGKGTLWIDDTGELSIADIRTRIRQMVRQHGIKLVLIDYAQIVLPISKRGMAEERLGIAEVCAGLKACAKQCGVVMIVLAQVNRSADDNPGGRPKLKDFDGSSAIDKWADFAAFIHRPSKHRAWSALKEEDRTHYGDEDTYNQAAELHLVKSRNSGEANIPLKFIGHLARFEPATKKLWSNDEDECQQMED